MFAQIKKIFTNAMSPKIRAMSVYIDTLMPISSKKNKKDPRAMKNRAICKWTLKNDIF